MNLSHIIYYVLSTVYCFINFVVTWLTCTMGHGSAFVLVNGSRVTLTQCLLWQYSLTHRPTWPFIVTILRNRQSTLFFEFCTDLFATLASICIRVSWSFFLFAHSENCADKNFKCSISLTMAVIYELSHEPFFSFFLFFVFFFFICFRWWFSTVD